MIQHGYYKDIQTMSNYSFFLKRYKKTSQEVGIFYTELFPVFSFLEVHLSQWVFGMQAIFTQQG